MRVIASESSDGNEPSNVIDDDFNTVWSYHHVGSWLQLDLGSSVKICRVDIAWGDGDAARNNFVISVSDDHIHFIDKVSRTSESVAPYFDNYSLPEGTDGRYVRITLKGANWNSQGKISEILVFGHSR